ncbi:hypothetical protein ACRWEM_26015, partial [Escherichia coli]
CPLTDFGGKTSIFSHPVYLFLRKFSLQDFRGGSVCSDMGIFNGSFVDHSWFCLLDRASGYVDKSFQKNNIHYRL